MKIDDFIREAMVKTDAAAKGNAEVGASNAINVAEVLAEISADTDFSMPDLLQAFGRMVSQRQQLTDSLPNAVRERLTDSNRVTDNNSRPVTTSGVSIQQGVSGLVRENRSSMDAIRQVTAELEYVERVPELSEVFSADTTASKNPMQMEAGNIKGQQAIPQGKAPEVLQSIVDEGLKTLQSVALTEKNTLAPATVLATLLDKAIQSGTVGKELSGWGAAVSVALDNVAEDPEVSVQLASWMTRVDPEVARLAETTGRPELVKLWAATQAWGSTSPQSLPSSLPTSTTLEATQAAMGTTAPGISLVASDGLETVKALLQSLAVESGGALAPHIVSIPTTVASRVGQFELLLSTLGARPETLNKLMSLLPELVTATEKKLPARAESKEMAGAFDTLARSAPKWVQTMSERADKPELLEFWVAAKMADLAPWAKLSSAERQQAAANLKELAVTFEQPNVVRTACDDSSSRGLMLQMALYAPEQGKTYPALIQIFEEKRERGNGQPPEQEVWVRVSLETDNIGTVDLSFRLQDKKYLSIFSRFADPEAASAFRTVLPEIRKEFAGTSLELKKIAVTQRTGIGVKTVE